PLQRKGANKTDGLGEQRGGTGSLPAVVGRGSQLLGSYSEVLPRAKFVSGIHVTKRRSAAEGGTAGDTTGGVILLRRLRFGWRTVRDRRIDLLGRGAEAEEAADLFAELALDGVDAQIGVDDLETEFFLHPLEFRLQHLLELHEAREHVAGEPKVH